MQTLCLQACLQLGVQQTLLEPKTFDVGLAEISRITEVTSSLADFSTVVEAMHAGPKMRGQERSEFSFEDGSKGDVYRAVLLAIATDPPTMSLRYAELMSRINDLCVDKAPVGSSISEACISRAPQLIGTPRKRTISAGEVLDGQAAEHRSEAGRRGATARVWRSVARPWWQDVATPENCSGAAVVAGRGPRDRLSRSRRHGGDAERLARCVPRRRRGSPDDEVSDGRRTGDPAAFR